MKISIITVCYNSDKTIEKTILSVLSQTYNNIEYIVIDGKSTDNTLCIIDKYKNRIDYFISENDSGIYDAINKGITRATGEIIGILNSDDVFFDDLVISRIANFFNENKTYDSIIGDIVFQNDSNEIIRKYSSINWSPSRFAWGYMPPHPSFYCKKDIYTKYGLYNTNFKIAADYELLIRLLEVHKITYNYIPMIFVKMKLGGASTKGISSLLTINKEVLLACKLNGVKTNYLKLLSKYFKKMLEFVYLA